MFCDSTSTTSRKTYTQASGNGEHPNLDGDIVSSALKDAAAKKFYVYAYLDTRCSGLFKYSNYEFNFKPMYIGKGQGNRVIFHLNSGKSKSSNHLFTNKLNKMIREGFSPEIKIIKGFDLESEAHKFEVSLISLIGRIDIKTGSLANLTDGGEGTSGRVYSDETRKKISDNHADFKGSKHHSFGLKRSKETCVKIGQSSLGRVHSTETRSKISESTKIWHMSEKGLKFSNELSQRAVSRKLADARWKALIGLINSKESTTLREASEISGYGFSNIRRQIRMACADSNLTGVFSISGKVKLERN